MAAIADSDCRPEADGLVCAWLLDGQGGGRMLDWSELERWSPQDGVVWVHLDRGAPQARQWLAGPSGLDPLVVEVLCAEETRPREARFAGGQLVNLRGVNLNPDSDPSDMIALRLWLEPRRVITVRRRRLMAVQELRGRLEAGHGPRDAADFLVDVSDALLDRMGPVIASIDEKLDDFEDLVLEGHRDLRQDLVTLRRRAILLRRYLSPQRDVLTRLAGDRTDLLDEARRLELREVADRLTRYVEDLEAARERAIVVQEEIASRNGEDLNRRMYVLSVAAAVFLPLGLLTGLLGINVGGMPGVDDPLAFWVVAAALVALAGMEWLLLRSWKIV